MTTKVHIPLFQIISVILFISTASFSQYDDLVFEHLTTEEGLPHLTVNCIEQDYLGFLWFGTQNGLVMYDGYTMKVYRPESGDSNSISQGDIKVIYEDNSHNLWIGTGWDNKGGLNLFNRQNETFTRFMNDPNDSTSINHDYIQCLYEDKSERLWIGTKNGLNLFNKIENNFKHYYFQESEKIYEASVVAICENHLTDELLVSSELKGLWKCNLGKYTLSKIKYNNEAEYLNNLFITSFTQNDDEFLWLGTNMGLAKLNLKTQDFNFYQVIKSKKFVPENVNDFRTILKDRNKNIWIGTNGQGLVRFDQRKEEFKVYKYDQFDQRSFYGSVINDIYEDNFGIIWYGMKWFGCDRLSHNKINFSYLTSNPADNNSLSGYEVYAICEDINKTLWFGIIDRGIDHYDRKNNKFTNYCNEPGNSYSLSDNNVYCLIEDPYEDNVLWAGTKNGGLNKFYSNKGVFKRYLHNPSDGNSISHNRIMYLFIDSYENLWIGTWGGGLDRFDRENEKFIHYRNDPKDPNSISQNRIACIYEDSKKQLWIGTDDKGLNRFDPETGSFIVYKSLLNNGAPSAISCIYEDRAGNFWLGTFKTGIHLFDREKGNSIKNFDDRDGLGNNWVMAILEDNNGSLWISTAKGLSKFDPISESIKTYGISDGLISTVFNPKSALKASSGELFFGGLYGLNYFHPDRIKIDTFPPHVVITDISLFNRPDEKLRFDKDIPELKEVKLTHNYNDLRFDYVGLHYSEPKENKYKYMLEGFDNDWVFAGTQRNATYTNLDPGEYTFMVTAANRDGIWNEKGSSIKLIILPPIWATSWAYLFYIFSFATIIYYTWKLQLNRIRIKHDYEISKFEAEKLHEVDQLKSRFFANISHEFRTPLTLIFGPLKDIIDKTNEPDIKKNVGIIKRNAARLYDLVNQLLDLSKFEAGKMKLETSEENIIPFLRGLVLSFTSLAERKHIELKFDSDVELLNVYFDKEKMIKIVNNLLSNSFKFTSEGGEINFTVRKTPNHAEIKISDNGRGIPANEIDKVFDRFYQVDGSYTREGEGTGIGLSLTKELVELHKGTILVESEEGTCTIFTILLPLGKEHLKKENIIEEEQREKGTDLFDKSEILLETEIEIDTQNKVDFLNIDQPLLLIIEDNTDVRNYIKGHLKEDYKLLEAIDGQEGLEKATENIPDLIISDLMMPKMDGMDLCNKLKNDERTSHIPIIILTAKATNQDKIEGYKTGADDYIMKPFDTDELKTRVQNLLEQRKRLYDHFRKSGLIEIDNKDIKTPDKTFLRKVRDIIEKHISDTSFNVDIFADEIGMSRSQLHRKLVSFVGESPGELISRIRIEKAAKLIENTIGNISEIALEVGFNNPAYFATRFRKHFHISPSEYSNTFKNKVN